MFLLCFIWFCEAHHKMSASADDIIILTFSDALVFFANNLRQREFYPTIL